ncbi:lytic transglycosylase F [Mesorhizobium sp. VK25A]|uniref:Lytic transglycosylase F n=1 Tax=Mesorhizobium vachelliae TaxID=3072309 RepID=A0ABU4ZZJ5_9HYPH|nr:MULTISPECIES: lytic transglycosylase F [unclassified Mesorhizobium]MDX8530828.1 lytic transglycosylase F [Mesorhizobium sp. VK25D]MDX8543421.1 lytic transglycosylase F [Mesorhizobium sp. VK25A]
MAASAEDLPKAASIKTWTGDFDGMEKRRVIRILVPYSKTIYFIDKGRELGTAVELGQALESWLNKRLKKTKEVERIRVAYVPVARKDLLPDLVAGLGDIVSADLTVTPARQLTIDFSDAVAGGVTEALVTGPAASPVASLDDLGGKEVYVRKTSSYYEHLIALNQQRKAEGKPEIAVKEIDENLEDEDILEMVNAGLLPWCVVDRFNARIWAQVFDKLTVHDDIAISTGGDIAFGMRKDSPKLKEVLDAFVKEHKVGTTFGNILKKRYYQSDKMVRTAYAPAEIAKFKALWLLFQTYAKEYDFDPLLLVAQGFQESQLNQTKRSPRGAVGIMQLLPSTAADKAVGIKGIADNEDRNVEAGAKYLRHLSEVYITDDGPKPLDRMLMTLAAYNAGPNNLKKFRNAAIQMGLDPNVWFGNVENGAAKIVGRETVQYVSNIYKYYIAYSMYVDQMAVRNEATKVNKGQ